MSQEPQQVVPYETRAIPEKPACIAPIAIVGISLGGLTVLMRVIGFLGAIFLATFSRNMKGMPQYGPVYQAFQIGDSLLFAALGGLLLTASIGCLRMKEWGRAWLVRYAMVYPVALVLEIIAFAVIVLPETSKAFNAAAGGGTPPPAAMKSAMTGVLIGGQVIQLLVLMILPVFILVFLRKPA